VAVKVEAVAGPPLTCTVRNEESKILNSKGDDYDFRGRCLVSSIVGFEVDVGVDGDVMAFLSNLLVSGSS